MEFFIDTICYEIPDENFAIMVDASVRLVEIRQRGCSHLCVDNAMIDCLLKMMYAYVGLYEYNCDTFIMKKMLDSRS